MRKVKLHNKFQKSAEMLFDNQNPDKNSALSSINSTNILKAEKERSFIKEHKSFLTLLKQVFIFLPGAFLLFFMSFGLGIILMETFVFGRTLDKLPEDYPFQFTLMGLIILMGTLMTWFGLGDIKNRKHFAIPASLLVTGTMFGATVKVLSKISGLADRILDDFTYLIYLLPLALILSILVKGLVDGKPKILREQEE